MRKQLKTIIYEILETSESSNLYSLADDCVITCLILINVGAFIASTSPSLVPGHQSLLENIEIVSSLVFTIEYVLRLWVCTVDCRYSHPLWGRLEIRSYTAKSDRFNFYFTLLLLAVISQFKLR
jgi:voltage-gated potassium channel